MPTTAASDIETLGAFRTFWTGWLNRPDITSALADTLMNRAIARIERECRLPCMETTESAVPDANGFLSQIVIPSDFLEVKWIEGDNRVLKPIDINALYRLQPPPGWQLPPSVAVTAPVYPPGAPPWPGIPNYYSRSLGNFLLRPCPQNYATMYYYAQFAQMVADTDTTPLLQSCPELLLWATLSYAGDYFKMDELQQWEARYQQEKAAVVQLGQDADYGGGPQAVECAYGGHYL